MPPAPSTPLSRFGALCASAVILLQASSGTGLAVPEACTARPELRSVVRAAGRVEHLAARVTGCYDQRPADRPGQLAPAAEQRVLAAAFGAAGTGARLDAQRDADVGSLSLVLGRSGRAVSLLERAAAAPEVRAAWLSDLAAAYLTRGDQQARQVDYVEALETAERALARDPAVLEAWFNRAVAMDRLALPHAADGWADYLVHDWRSPSANAARFRRASLGAAAQRRRDDLHEAAGSLDAPELAIYVDWASATRRGDGAGAARALEAGRGRASRAERRGDRFHGSVVADLARAADVPRHAAALAAALEELGRGFAAAGVDDLAAAGVHFTRASRQLAGRCEALQALADLRRAIVHYYTGAADDATRLLARTAAVARAGGFEVLFARALRVRGLIDANRGAYDAALEAYRDALAAANRAGATEQSAALRTLVSEVLEYLGQRSEAWDFRAGALRALPAVGDPQQRQMIVVTSALAALRDGMPEAARHFHRAALDAARRSGNPAEMAEAWTLGARIARELGRREDEEAALGQAGDAVARIADPSLRARNAAELALARAAAGQPGADVDGALRYFSSLDALSRLSEVYHARALAHRDEGDPAGARAELHRAVDMFETRARALDDRERRLTHDATGRPLYDALVAMYASGADDQWEVLHAVERYRRRLEPAGIPGMGPWRAEVFSRLEAAGAGALVFSAQPDRLLIWRIGRAGHVRLIERAMSREYLAALVDTFNEAVLENDKAGAGDVGRLLFTLLLEPAGDLATDRVWIVPDGPLHRLPFAALTDAATGLYAMERWTLVQRPSLAMPQPRALRRPARGALIVGNPAGQAAALREAEREARELAGLYGPGSAVLTGSRATRRAVQHSLSSSAILHFGGHAVVNPEHPLLSRLVLAADPSVEKSGDLFVYDVERMDIGHVQLAVLAACRSADSRAGAADGVVSLAGALLGRGVRTVVATLFDIDDAAARRLFVKFHEEYRRTGDGAASLRAAQLSQVRSGSAARLSDWSGVIAAGE